MTEQTPIYVSGIPDTALSTLRLLPSLKDNAQSFADRLADDLDSGTVSPREIARYFKLFELVQEKLKTRLDEYVLDSLGADKSTEEYGIRWEKAEFGTKYFYENCGDKKLDELNEKMIKLKADIEARQKMLKSLTGKTTIVDNETGECIDLFPPIKTSTSGVKKTIL